MNFSRLLSSGALSLVVCFAAIGASSADDHRHGRGIAKHRKGFRLVDPRGQVVTEPKMSFRFIVPSTRNLGAYYTHDDKYYYTPAPQQPVEGRPVQVQRPDSLEFGAFKHHHELAERLEREVTQFCLDLNHNYQRNENFDETYQEAYDLLRAVKSLDQKTEEENRQGLRRSATKIDNLFHHVQGEVAGWRGEDRRPIGDQPLPAKLEELEALIHHLMYDLGVKPEHDRR